MQDGAKQQKPEYKEDIIIVHLINASTATGRKTSWPTSQNNQSPLCYMRS
jgi:hypothetical protein